MSDKGRKKILFLITKSNWGGAQRYVYDLAINLDTKLYEPVVVTSGTGELLTKLGKAQVRTITLDTLQRDVSLYKEVCFVKELWKLFGKEKPDVIHVNSSKAGGIGCLVGRLRGIKRIIFTAHGWAFNEDRPRWQRILIGLLHWSTVVLSHKTIAVSQQIKQQLRGPFLQHKWVLVHNGRAPIAFTTKDTARQMLHLDAAIFTTGSIGELHPIKQHNVMIQVVKALKDKGLLLHHVIIGGGEMQSKLHSLIEQLGVGAQVTLTGPIDEAARYLPAFDLFVQPSRSEALAYTVVEAAQAGLPIIASNVGGMPEIITHNENGLLVPSGDIESLCSAITRLYNHPDLCSTLGSAARITSNQFTFDTMLKKTIAVYEDKILSSDTTAVRASV